MKRKIGLFIFFILGILCLFLTSSSNSKYEEKEEIREIIVDNTIEKEDCNSLFGESKWQMSCDGQAGAWGAVGLGFAGLALVAITPPSGTSFGTHISSNEWCAIGNINSGYTTPSSSPNSTNEEIVEITAAVSLSDLADKLLDEAEDTYGWTSDELTNELANAMNEVKDGVLKKVKEILNKKIRVYLGTYIPKSEDSYEKAATKDEGSIVFSMDGNEWNRLSDDHPGGMWLLNQLFLSYVISKDCEFVLVTNPNKYYFNGQELTEKSYSKELHYIDINGYHWNVSDSETYILVTRG